MEMSKAEATADAPHLFQSQSTRGSNSMTGKTTDYNECCSLGASDFHERNGQTNIASCANRRAYLDGWYQAQRDSRQEFREISRPLGHGLNQVRHSGARRGERGGGPLDG